MKFWQARKATREQDAHEWVARARGGLFFARAHPDFCCDVCGPHGHYHHLCCDAVRSAIKGLLVFQGQRFEEPTTNLQSLAALAFKNSPDRDRCMQTIARLVDYPGFDVRDPPPTPTMLDETFRHAEEIVATIASALPKE